jgi:predicted NBD/HSP70 family sugar kinase
VIDQFGKLDEKGIAGTLERSCSGYWLARDHGKSAEELFKDEHFVASYSKQLAIGLSNLVLITNPELLVLGGGITQAGDSLLEPLTKNMSGLLEESGTKIEVSKLGNKNVLIGARKLAEIELRL